MPLTPLPIDAELPKVLAAISEKPRILLQSPPGSGKSTRLPPALIQTLPERIFLLQPRRSSTLLVAHRIAEEGDWKLGQEVGYAMRLHHEYSQKTRLVVATQGTFLQMLGRDPMLPNTSCVILDEFHERSLDLDLLTGMLLYVQREIRPDLKIVWMSATLNESEMTGKLDAHFIGLPGKTFPVDLHYLRPQKRALDLQAETEKNIVATLKDIYKSNAKARTLVFLPGKREIGETLKATRSALRDLSLRELHGSLSLKEQEEVLRSTREGEIIFSTNIAETSVTLPNIAYVVDSGLQKSVRYDEKAGREYLRTEKIPADAAEQRAGRAGRTQKGICYRMWTDDEQRFLDPFREAEILHRSLEEPLLRVIDFGFQDVAQFPWLTPPPVTRTADALERLSLLGAVGKGNLTTLGKKLLSWPLDLRWGVFLTLLGDEHPELFGLGATLCAMAGGENSRPFSGDFLELAENTFRRKDFSRSERELFEDLCRRAGKKDTEARPLSDSDMRALHRLLLRAFPDRLARKRARDASEALMVSKRGVVWKGAGPRSEFFIALEVSLRPDSTDSYLQSWIEVEASDVEQSSAALIRQKVFTEEKDGRLQVFRQKCFLDLPLAAAHGFKVDREEEKTVLRDLLSSEWKNVLDENESLKQIRLRHRLAFGSEWVIDLDRLILAMEGSGRLLDKSHWRSFDAEAVLDQLFEYSILKAFREKAPTHYQLPNGRNRPLFYREDGDVDVEIILQDLLGQRTHPTVGKDKTPLRIHLLSPARRPIQVTKDLPGFWKTSYPQVRKELRGRYPKHKWPEDPLA